MELRTLGVCVSLDDFGTGAPSLGYLQRFPVDTLRSIGPSCTAWATATSAGNHPDHREPARTLRLDVVAEGAETAEQVSHLESLECRCGQGFFFHKPMPFEDVVRTFLGERSLSLLP
jgi:EAL domain-containing protein (putative c-di-GMP-specific phosphodiesterase class I)